MRYQVMSVTLQVYVKRSAGNTTRFISLMIDGGVVANITFYEVLFIYSLFNAFFQIIVVQVVFFLFQ